MICDSCSNEYSNLLTVQIFEDESKKCKIGDKRNVCRTCLEGLRNVGVVEIHINNLSDLAVSQIQAIVGKTKIEAKGSFTPPPLDLIAIKERADKLDPKSKLKADIYMLLIEIDKLKDAANCVS